MIDNIHCRDIWVTDSFETIKNATDTKYIKCDTNHYGFYHLYNYFGLSIKLYDKFNIQKWNKQTSNNEIKNGIEISGSIRKYYCKRYKKDICTYDLSTIDIGTIISDFKGIGLNPHSLQIIGVEFGLTINDNGDVLKKLVALPYFKMNMIGSNSIEFLSSRTNERYGSRKFIFYKPEVNYKRIKATEESKYLRIEFNIPNRTQDRLNLMDEFDSPQHLSFSELSEVDTLNNLKEYLLNQLKGIKCVFKQRIGTQLTKKRELADLALTNQESIYKLKLFIEKYKTNDVARKKELDNYKRTLINKHSENFVEDRELLDNIIIEFNKKYNEEIVV